MGLTAQDISQLSADRVDDLFRSGRVGQIPDGEADGTAIFWPGSVAEPFVEAVVSSLAWKGKVVNARGRNLKNRISPLGVPAISADVYTDRSWFDGGECIVLDYSKRSFVAKYVRDEIRKVAPGLYLGLVYLGRTRLIYFTLQFTV
jgi:hypothetical protein